ncbi:MAG TPA: NADH-quinone oxidoreductase subunit M [Gemmatimonadaceae bacterium]|nr:NADH-quinone oxidoreductase subunit M [Gemmatimonadaceae bacterium]
MRDFLAGIGYGDWVLPALLVIPIAGAILIYVARIGRGRGDDIAAGGSARVIALVTLVAEFLVSAGLWWTFDTSLSTWQNVVMKPWIPEWGANFIVGIDGISLMMILLTTFIMPLAVLGSWTSVREKLPAYYALLLVLTTGMIGVFVALDLLLFYVMWEVMLVPMYFIIGIWGGERRLYASIKFFLYTMVGSLLMLVAILYLWIQTWQAGAPTFSYDTYLRTIDVSRTVGLLLFGAFFLAFAVKVPMFPFHTWLPDAHVEAPTAGSVILAGIMLKMGTYGFLRFAMPLFPDAVLTPVVRTTMLALAVIGIIYGALVAMVQPDFKKLVAYSSVSHLGFVMLGILALTLESVQGALMVMINHGISTGALFFLIGMIYERRHSRLIDAYGGIARVVPLFAAMLTIVSLSSIGLPSTNGFVGEFLVLVGSFRTQPIWTLIATTGVIFAAAYLLWAIQRILFQRVTHPDNERLTDLNLREGIIMAALVIPIFWIGIYPKPILDRMERSAAAFLTLVTESRPAAGAPSGE